MAAKAKAEVMRPVFAPGRRGSLFSHGLSCSLEHEGAAIPYLPFLWQKQTQLQCTVRKAKWKPCLTFDQPWTWPLSGDISLWCITLSLRQHCAYQQHSSAVNCWVENEGRERKVNKNCWVAQMQPHNTSSRGTATFFPVWSEPYKHKDQHCCMLWCRYENSYWLQKFHFT